MLTLSNLKPKLKKKIPKRVGRGASSGSGGYSGRGIKGQKSRTGASIPAGFEGGRMPLIRQMPKARGFKSIHPKNQIVDIKKIIKAFPEGGAVSPKLLFQKGLISDQKSPVKIVGQAKPQNKFTFQSISMTTKAKASFENV